MSHFDRSRERQQIRRLTATASETAAKGNCGPAITDALFYEQVVLAICNLAETLDARGAGVLDRLSDREGDR